MTEVRYDRALLVETVTYHPQLQTSACRCGWGRWPSQLGRSHAEHVASVYELRAAGQLLMATTATGAVCHLTRDTFRSLCGRRLSDLVCRLDDGEPVPYADHWRNDAVTFGDELCAQCVVRSSHG